MSPSAKPVILVVDPEGDASATVEQLVAGYCATTRSWSILTLSRPVNACGRSPSLQLTLL